MGSSCCLGHVGGFSVRSWGADAEHLNPTTHVVEAEAAIKSPLQASRITHVHVGSSSLFFGFFSYAIFVYVYWFWFFYMPFFVYDFDWSFLELSFRCSSKERVMLGWFLVRVYHFVSGSF